MIKIHLDNAKKEYLKLLHRQVLAEPYNIISKVKDLKLKYVRSDLEKSVFFNLIEKKFEAILFSEPIELEALLIEIDPLYQNVITKINSTGTKKAQKKYITDFKSEVYSIFDYSRFCKTYNGYGAYALTDYLKIRVCPYCNRQKLSTILTKKSKTRPTLDHWYSKSQYPYFALSVFNLIPSCYSCNSDLKNSKKFTLIDYIHPYLEGYTSEYKFKTSVTKANYKSGDVLAFNIKLKPEIGIPKEIKRKTLNNIDVFCLETIYNDEKETAAKIIYESDQYSKTYIEENILTWGSAGKPLYKNIQEVIERQFKLVLKLEDLGNEPLSKFRRDIAEEQGLKFA